MSWRKSGCLDSAGYYDLLELTRDPDIVSARVAALCAQFPPAREADIYYLRPSTTYLHAATINWNKNAVLRFAHRWLKAWYGDDVYRLRRPLLLQEPKLFVATACLVPGVAVLLMLAGASLKSRLYSHPASENDKAGQGMAVAL